MKVLKTLLLIILGCSILIFANNNQSLPTPPPPVIKIPPPKNLDEAIERIPDYFKLIEILPPVINKQKFFKEFFGNYSEFISFLVKNQQNIEELKKLSSTEEGKSALRKEFINFINKQKEAKIEKYTYNKNEIFSIENSKKNIHFQNMENYENKQTLYENLKPYSKQQTDNTKNEQGFSIKQILLISIIILLIFIITLIKFR